MSGPLEGIRVVEMASWMFVPSAASVLVDWGADVLKVENPDGGDPQRGLISSGLLPGGAGGVNFMVEQPNRGKRSLAINLAHPDGREAFMKVVETADVFLTNYLPSVRQRLGIDVEDLRSRNPDLIVARGSGQGPKGPDAEKGGYDGASFWARGGVSAIFPEGPDGWPQGQPSPAFGDVMGGLAIAGAISAALVRRERTGEPSVVDVSLLATAMWQVSPLVVASKLFGFGLCERLDRTDLATDPRFCDSTVRAENAGECIAQLDEAFGSQSLEYWKDRLEDFSGVWTPFQTLTELYEDVQTVANGYLPSMEAANGDQVQLVASPAQFDEAPIGVERAPELGEHTEVVLNELGVGWDELASMKDSGAIL